MKKDSGRDRNTSVLYLQTERYRKPHGQMQHMSKVVSCAADQCVDEDWYCWFSLLPFLAVFCITEIRFACATAKSYAK